MDKVVRVIEENGKLELELRNCSAQDFVMTLQAAVIDFLKTVREDNGTAAYGYALRFIGEAFRVETIVFLMENIDKPAEHFEYLCEKFFAKNRK